MIRILFISISVLIFLCTGCDKQVSFDSEEWKSSGGESIMTNKRLNMSHDLLAKKLLLNKTYSEIDSLIGNPSRTNKKDINIRNYIVKEVYRYNIDPEELIYIAVKFDQEGKSIDAELIKTK